jgi:photosystem II stability/assembly factor-like uncharacterized protein
LFTTNSVMNKNILKLVLSALLLLGYTTSNAQKLSYKQMMYDMSYNFYEVVEAAERHFENKSKGKGSGWKGYERWKNENESKYYPSGNRSEIDHYLHQKQFKILKDGYKHYHYKTSFDNGWVELGPWDANNITQHYSPGIGRVETFYVDPTDSNRIFIGSRSGGFWRSTDGGANWENTTDFLVASGVNSIAVNPNNKNEVLIAVQHGGNGYTYGIYKSTDGGSNWSLSDFEPNNLGWGGLGDNERIYKIQYHPAIANRIFIGTTQGLFISDDNLNSWIRPLTSWTTDFEFHPTKQNVVYAYRYTSGDASRIKISSDTGKTFTNSNIFSGNNNARGFISTTPAMPDYVYFASSKGVWRSKDEGTNFNFLVNPDESCLGFAVSDLDTSNMIYGYVDLESSTDGGYNFTQVTRWSVQNTAYVHADLRVIECYNGVFYAGTDGYFVKSNNNGKTWTILNDGTAIREFYAVGNSQSNNKVHMAGSQDNGTSILNNNGWIEWNGGDGMEALIHPLNDQIMLGSWQYGSRNYTEDGGLTRKVVNNPDRGQGNAAWEAPLLQDPLNQRKIYHFSDLMYASTDYGLTWDLASNPGLGQIGEAAISENNSDLIAISRGSSIRLTEDGGANWNIINNNLPSGSITDIAFDPNNDSTILVTYNSYINDNKKVYISNDLGETWNNITYNLGAMPLRTVVVDHTDSSFIYVGGEIGVYYKSMEGNTWTLYNNNFPNVTVKDLEIHYGSNSLKAATWGRGLWEYTLVGRNDFPSIATTSINNPPDENNPKYSTDQYVTATIDYDNTLSSVFTIWSADDISLEDTLPMVNVGGNVWKTTQPFPYEDEGTNIYFRVVAIGSNNDRSESYRFQFEIKEFEYCFALGSTSTSDDHITKVVLEDINYETTQDFYGNFTNQSTELVVGREYELEITLGNSYPLDTTAGWIDFNNDATFSEDELIVMSDLNSNHESFGKFTVPQDAILNKDLRLRTRSQYWGQAPNPCGELYGEVEDYTVVIKSNASTPTLSSDKTIEIYPNPTSGKIEIELNDAPQDCIIIIYDVQGKVVFEQAYKGSYSITIDKALTPGIYHVEAKTKENSSKQKLIVY